MTYFQRKAIEGLSATLGSRPIPGLPSRGGASGSGRSADTPPVASWAPPAGPIVETAPVISPPTPVEPGSTARMCVSMVNDDERPARIVFRGTSLIGGDGAQIPADRVSFLPGDLTLSPGATGEVLVVVMVPAHAPCGVYAGLIRAADLDHLHAVLVVEVGAP